MDQMDQPQKQQQQQLESPTTGTTTAFNFNYLATHPTSWTPDSLEIPLNIRFDGCIVPSSQAPEGARISYSHLIVMDGFVDDATRREIKNLLVVSGDGNDDEGTHTAGVRHLPSEKWERKTADMAGAAPTWGLRPHVLEMLQGGGGQRHLEGEGEEDSASSSLPHAVLEIQSRLVKLYPEYQIAHLPSQAIQNRNNLEEENEEEEESASAKRVKLNTTKTTNNVVNNDTSVDCSAILANAAAQGDTFRYHVDADPTSFPPSNWTRSFGEYFNGEPGKPLLVTLLIYLDDTWERDWGGETFFLDGTTDTGIFVRPKPGRAILMEQDVVHKVNPPSVLADGRLRLSLVWKLVFIPKNGNFHGEEVRLARQEWGQPTSFGSAARVDAVKRQLLAEKKKKGR